MRSYGVKNPTQQKEETKISQAAKYYPKDKVGNYDEWAAVAKT